DEQAAAGQAGLAGPEARRAMAHRPRMADAVGMFNEAVFASELPPRLHELVRYRIAGINGCARCQAYRSPAAQAIGVDEALLSEVENWRSTSSFSAGERRALEYAERFCIDPKSIDVALIDALRFDLGDDGVVDLSLCVAKYLAIGRFISVLDLDQVCVIGSPKMVGG
ncbi:MAG: hypothetical protein GWP48_13110, partial [Actinobacteria bacterium]|nr:hypothetical protein [Actinomycetota bacterium]